MPPASCDPQSLTALAGAFSARCFRRSASVDSCCWPAVGEGGCERVECYLSPHRPSCPSPAVGSSEVVTSHRASIAGRLGGWMRLRRVIRRRSLVDLDGNG